MPHISCRRKVHEYRGSAFPTALPAHGRCFESKPVINHIAFCFSHLLFSSSRLCCSLALAMAQAQAQAQAPPPADATMEFLDFLDNNELSCGSNGPKFVCINAVRTHLAGPRPDYKILKRLLHALFVDRDKPDAQTILDNHVAMLCILTKLRKGAFIYHFVRHGLCDKNLPYTSKSPPQGFPPDTENDKFYEEFCQKQWMFCVPDFPRGFVRDFVNDWILPITKKTPQGGGGSAKVFKIQIHPCYNKFHNPQSNTPGSCPTPLVRNYRLLCAARH
jgi:hypothetical protein